MKIKKWLLILTVFCAILTISIIFTACNNDNANNNNNTDADKSTDNLQQTDESAPSETVEINYYKNIPEDLNYGGYTFTIITWDPAKDGWSPYIDVEMITGEVLNDTAYNRNMEVSERLGIELSFIYREIWNSPDLIDQVIKDIAADDCPYDIIIPWATSTKNSSLITQNLLYDWKQVSYVDLSADWYKQNASEAYTINGKQYFLISDFTYPLQGCGSPLLFNKDLFLDMGLDFPYQLVYNNKWTFDALYGYMKGAYVDLNNDGKKNYQDRYGLVTHPIMLARSIISWGEPTLKLDGNGFVLNIFNDKIADMVTKLVDFRSGSDVFMSRTLSGDDGIYNIFNNGNALFEIFGSDPVLLRSIEFDFGYLPYPKYNEQQKDYITDGGVGGMMGIPSIKTEEEATRIGAVIEAFSESSAKYVKDAFIRQYIENKILRDEDSVNMYRIMQNSAFYELSPIFSANDLINSQLKYYVEILEKDSVNLASQYEKHSANLTAELEKIYETIIGNQ